MITANNLYIRDGYFVFLPWNRNNISKSWSRNITSSGHIPIDQIVVVPPTAVNVNGFSKTFNTMGVVRFPYSPKLKYIEYFYKNFYALQYQCWTEKHVENIKNLLDMIIVRFEKLMIFT